MSKFNRGLVSDIQKDLKEAEEQKNVRNKYHIEEDEERIIIVKNNIIRTIFTVVRAVFSILFFALAVIGLAALIYPGSREELIKQMNDVYIQLKVLLF